MVKGVQQLLRSLFFIVVPLPGQKQSACLLRAVIALTTERIVIITPLSGEASTTIIDI
ncbi:MAG: hypothetical protein SVO26_06820 [Chloroflexota bacterium]|nr:hypothetical protein [Chloroflexota bacterium]